MGLVGAGGGAADEDEIGPDGDAVGLTGGGESLDGDRGVAEVEALVDGVRGVGGEGGGAEDGDLGAGGGVGHDGAKGESR